MSHLPVELIEEIIDIVAECYPQSLPACSLVSRQWNPRSKYLIHRTFRRPTLSTFDALLAFVDIVKVHPRLAALAETLQVAPNLKLNTDYASSVPFHHLSSRILPHVHRLVLKETLRWNDSPPLYSKGTFGSSFSNVNAIELSCQFGSAEDLHRAVRSFKNVKEVRLSYPHHALPQWMFGHTRPFRGAFKLQDLELPASIIHESRWIAD
ncbi:hypothetical protein GSI_14735 [Ganoderma sinense ZZ0214-1]|uniref:F-box domain-containing protein n=1 Tax=Ganoderma sinense ZZ0214-1 TaxID=1077348 RepID=A0A2G8RPI0_9APHY|nr:hypothetical protein GSI_14735 [Ganoderma sinense ZZ0214-1]